MGLRKLRVVHITKVPEAYPECRKDTADFPNLVQYVEDETDTFIVDEVTGAFWPASEFFFMNRLKEIAVDPEGLS